YFPGKKDEGGNSSELVAWSWTPEVFDISLSNDEIGLSLNEKDKGYEFYKKQMNIEKAESLWKKWRKKILY
ncbi:MAG: hypothetical protein KKA62_05300, partial [Nanoarchaeota archaeon]|nr:hypothetical protein [Nanoarchaeota archaeon]MBU1977338.1 hypothetical protein [Nanoarchaeota archaeon]